MNKKKIIIITLFSLLLIIGTISIISIILCKNNNVEYYQNGSKTFSKLDYKKDIKKIIYNNSNITIKNYPDGYSINIPKNMNPDFTLSPSFVRLSNQNLDIKISKEYSPYTSLDHSYRTYIYQFIKSPKENYKSFFNYSKNYFKYIINKFIHVFVYTDLQMESYLNDYINRFNLNKDYQNSNSMNLIDNKWTTINNYRTNIITLKRTPLDGSTAVQNQYVMAYIITDKKEYYSFFFRSDNIDREQNTINDILNSFDKIHSKGTANYNIDLKPIIPNWNKETTDFYNKLVLSDKVTWGYFYPHSFDDYSRIESIESKIDYHFPILLNYINIGYPFADFPTEGMQKAYERNQIVELTTQVSYLGNNNNIKHNANFDLLDGKFDDQIHQFAKDAKAFSHPFLFRLNNEMNTDWCQYSGVMLLNDPDIYIKIYRKIYDIFKEEGVDNAIWIFNPNFSNRSQSFPPANWNSETSYYPGNDYVQLFGITGYNTGTYFSDITGESWSSFDEIYAPMAKYYDKFNKFPWIITEFSSNSVGGDKEKWIRDMFNSLPKYKNIKAAVWWGYFDADYTKGVDSQVPARKYWLDEKDEYLKAFSEGIHRENH